MIFHVDYQTAETESRTPALSKMGLFMTKFNGFLSLTIVTESSILHITGALNQLSLQMFLLLKAGCYSILG